jgi:hypothetical protein
VSDPNEHTQHTEETELLHETIGDTDLLTSVVLIGASALIPLPFIDDIAKNFFEKRLVRTIVEREGLEIHREEAATLTQEPKSGCCALGCLSSAILYPIKKILRKVFFFLEIKRAIDQSTQALAQAWLFRLTLRRDLWRPSGDVMQADQLRQAIRAACHSQGVKPLETALRHGFEGAKGVFTDFASRFTSKFSGRTDADEKEMEKAVETIESEKKEELSGLNARLTSSVNEISGPYLERFAKTFEEQLAAVRAAAQVAARQSEEGGSVKE